MILFILFIRIIKEYRNRHTMEKQAAKNASGSKQVIKKEAETSRLERNRQQYERNKQEIVLTESELDAISSDYEEFLWTYDPGKPYSEYLAEAH
ncbi:hypothetical protein QL285_038632 [Trifolium repens]|nr:hypothetical protein QL285_038632 [Trifolium repens]